MQRRHLRLADATLVANFESDAFTRVNLSVTVHDMTPDAATSSVHASSGQDKDKDTSPSRRALIVGCLLLGATVVLSAWMGIQGKPLTAVEGANA